MPVSKVYIKGVFSLSLSFSPIEVCDTLFTCVCYLCYHINLAYYHLELILNCNSMTFNGTMNKTCETNKNATGTPQSTSETHNERHRVKNDITYISMCRSMLIAELTKISISL